MLTKTITTIFSIATLASFVNHSSNAMCAELTPTSHQKEIENIAYNNNVFGFRLLNQLALEESKNIVVSPYCISQSFAIAHLGARNETKKEIEQILNFDNSKGTFDKNFSDLNHNILRENSHYTFSMMNKIYIADGSNILPVYKKNILQNYNIFIENGNFKTPDNNVSLSINGVVAKSSNDKIKQFLPEKSIKDGTKMVFMNSAYMKGKWLKPFDPRLTTVRSFNSFDGSVAQVPTMSQQSLYNFAESYDFYSIEIPYESSNTSMIVILPKKRFNFILEHIESVYSYIQDSSEPSIINLKLPKFKIESNLSTLQRTFTAMGMKHFFGNKPDFSGISEAKDFSFGEIYHKAYLEVNEEGTVASSAAAMVGEKSTFSPKVRVLELNQPFIVVIRDTKTSQILFVGAVRKL
jgi:serpin B